MHSPVEVERQKLLAEFLLTRYENVEKIKNRTGDLAKENLDRSIQALRYFPGVKNFTAEGLATFSRVFEATFFNGYIFQSATDLGSKATLLSAQQRESTAQIISGNTTDLDREVGNDRFVFASSRLSMPGSGYFWGRNQFTYAIQPINDGWAASTDIVLFPRIFADDGSSTEEYLAEKIYFYVKNLFTLSNFKIFFSTYFASFFNSIVEALEFIQRCEKDFSGPMCFSDISLEKWATSDKIILERMRSLYVTKGVFPPLKPEFQFEGEVEATRIDNPT